MRYERRNVSTHRLCRTSKIIVENTILFHDWRKQVEPGYKGIWALRLTKQLALSGFGCVQFHSGTNKGLEDLLVDFLVFVKVYVTSHATLAVDFKHDGWGAPYAAIPSAGEAVNMRGSNMSKFAFCFANSVFVLHHKRILPYFSLMISKRILQS